MAICTYCFHDMSSGVGCVPDALHLGGVVVERVPYGREGRDMRRPSCGDCGAPMGSLHHPGCCLERCPMCGRQAITCGHRYDEDPPDDDDWYGDDAFDLDVGGEMGGSASGAGAVVSPPVSPHADPMLAPPTMSLVDRHGEDVAAAVDHDRRRPCPFDIDAAPVALVLEVISRHHTENGRHLLTRSTMVPLVNRLRITLADAGIPSGGIVDTVWAVVEWLAAVDRLDPRSDPLEFLEQPLLCHFDLGVGTDGVRIVDFPCQCFVDAEPALPDGRVHLRLPDGSTDLAIDARRADPATAMSVFDRFTAAAERNPMPATRSTTNLRLLGVLPAASGRPELWVFGTTMVPGSPRSLFLDRTGTAFGASLDRRYRSGLRWSPVTTYRALVDLR